MYKAEVEEMGIVARVVADSTNPNGVRLVTFELEYPRMIHAEVLVHRTLSRNASSSRAVPTLKAVEHVRNNLAMPVFFGLNQRGMSSSKEHPNREACEKAWKHFANTVCDGVEALASENLHKQIAARPLEPFQKMKSIVSATDLNNFFWLRDDADAQPEIQTLARVMKQAMQESRSVELSVGDWHTPYWGEGYVLKNDADIEKAKRTSVSCVAQVSYRNLDDSEEKTDKIFNMLIKADKMHASPLESVCSPIPDFDWQKEWPEGVTHINRNKEPYSGNMRGWLQWRNLFENNVKPN